MTKELIPVIDRPDLARDPASKAILSTDANQLREHRKKIAFMKTLINSNQEIENLKTEISEIKSLLVELLHQKNK